MNLYVIYLIGLVLSTAVFYHGATRGGAKHPGITSLIFGLFWFISVPLLIHFIRRDLKRLKRGTG